MTILLPFKLTIGFIWLSLRIWGTFVILALFSGQQEAIKKEADERTQDAYQTARSWLQQQEDLQRQQQQQQQQPQQQQADNADQPIVQRVLQVLAPWILLAKKYSLQAGNYLFSRLGYQLAALGMYSRCIFFAAVRLLIFSTAVVIAIAVISDPKVLEVFFSILHTFSHIAALFSIALITYLLFVKPAGPPPAASAPAPAAAVDPSPTSKKND